MSDVKQADDVMTLEDLFLSRDFGKPLAVTAPAENEMLFGAAPPRSPLVPLVAAPTAAHNSTTHRRRQMFAAVSGLAAVVLVGVAIAGAVTGKTKGGNSSVHAGGATTTTGNGTSVGKTGKGKTKTPTTVTPPLPGSTVGGGSGINLADESSGGSVVTSGDTISITVTKGKPGGSPTVTVTSNPPPPTGSSGGSSGGVLTPVVSLLGHVVTTAGTTVYTASVGLEGTLPGLSPVTGLVGSLGNGLTGLGDSLIA
jgi:hypothetical protein